MFLLCLKYLFPQNNQISVLSDIGKSDTMQNNFLIPIPISNPIWRVSDPVRYTIGLDRIGFDRKNFRYR